MLRGYTVVLIQVVIWGGYFFVEWLSHYDHPVYNVIMFLVFSYLAIMSGNHIIQSVRKTLLLTIVSLSTYMVGHFIYTMIIGYFSHK